jgi:hypothetical protein
MKNEQKSCQLAAPQNCAENFSVLQEKNVSMKFPMYAENRIFHGFVDGRIKPRNHVFRSDEFDL